jgi:dextranase
MSLKNISKMKNLLFVCLLCVVFSSTSCQKNAIKDNTGLINQQDSQTVYITTDKAMYSPGDKVTFTIDKSLPTGTKISYKYLNNEVEQQPLSGTSWTWTAPSTDFSGYMVELSGNENGKNKIYGCIAVDVSSDAARFPRNGFLSQYGQMSQQQIHDIMANLNRLHLNWIQFQDWEYKHHLPLAGTPENPSDSWKDIANRTNYKATVQGYIQSAKSFNMKTLSYNLCYGALSDAEADGVSDKWYLFSDMNHINKDVFQLPSPPFKSWIYFVNPANKGWQNYLTERNEEMYRVYAFDGYQIDQVGNRDKKLYDYDGNEVDLAATFNPFINAMKTGDPSKKLVMNAVNQYGQEGIATAPVDFLYSEVWAPNESYRNLAEIIMDNNRFSSNTKQTVLTAYMDYNLAENPGYFNTPGVLLTDAVIFAFGGAHLELGEHMLGKEYFPNDNLQMHPDLKAAMINYYDFLTAYQNLLRDGGTFNNPNVVSSDGKIKLNNWPPATGAVSIVGKDMGQKQIIHLINFADASSLEWRDPDGKQPKPETFTNAAINFQSDKTVKKIWFASPDVNSGASQNIEFNQSGNSVTFSLPSLQYWDMIVIEY